MNVLWIVNIIFPYPSECLRIKKNAFGGWLIGLFNELKKEKDINLSIACTYKGKKFLKFTNEGITYYLLPCKNINRYNKKLEKYWKLVERDFKPNIVHIHGTEYTHGLAFQNACPNIKTIVSIQGLVSAYAGYYIPNINYYEMKKNITIRNIIKDNIFKRQKNLYRSGVFEKESINKSTAILGRTLWDYSNVLNITVNNKYFKVNENLRDAFYNKKWNYNNINRFSIFISNASSSIKGFHIMIQSLNILKEKYPKIKICVAGKNFVDKQTFIDKIKFSDYQKYICNLINKYNLKRYIEFTDILDENKMVERLIKSNVYVQTSSIENSSNALGEAMLIGMPIVASNVGGTSDLLKDKEEGYLYPFGDIGLLTYYISKIFDDKEKSIKMGENAQKHAIITHDRKKNMNDVIKIYNKILED